MGGAALEDPRKELVVEYSDVSFSMGFCSTNKAANIGGFHCSTGNPK